MTKWSIKVLGHPCVISAVYPFESITEMEKFVGDNDIQIDHIEEIVRWKNHRPEAFFLCESKEFVRFTRMVLVKKPKARYNASEYSPY